MWKLSGKLSIPGRRILLDHYMVGHGPIELVRKLKKKKKKKKKKKPMSAHQERGWRSIVFFFVSSVLPLARPI